MAGILAFFIDAILGDPRTRLHPVVLMGNSISLLERILYRETDGAQTKLDKGTILVGIVLLTSFAIGLGLSLLSARIPFSFGREIAEGFFLSFMISPRSLAQAGGEIYGLLLAGNLSEARRKVGWIVGRDTEKLDEAEVSRATVETIAESTCDGIIAPLFFFAIGGLPLAFLYRAANTMDSMLGYKNDRYLYFGRAAARVDDVLNLIPARLSGLFLIFSAALLGYDYRNAFQIMCRDARKHPSPNSGFSEASVAGALRVRLGGFNTYFGKKTFRAYMGDAVETLSARHITAAIRMMYVATLLFLATLYVLSLIYSIGVVVS